MIKDFNSYVNEDYFSKLADRKDNGVIRKEQILTKDFVMEYFNDIYTKPIISFRKENGKNVVDVDGNFYLVCDTNKMPFQFGKVTGDFSCAHCEKLTSLEGCPKEVGGSFSCTNCTKLTSLEGCPKEVGREFYCRNCGRQFTEEEVKSLCNVHRAVIYRR